MFSRLFHYLRDRWWSPMEGDAKWDFAQKWVWPMIAPLAATIWGVIEDTPGPVLIQTVLAIFAIGLFLQQNWQQKSKKRTPPSTDADQESIGNNLTAKQAIQFIADLKKEEKRTISIKIVSTTEGQPLARMLVDAFLLTDYKVLVNDGNTDYLFPANTTHNKIILRYRETNNLKWPDNVDRKSIYFTLIFALKGFIGVNEHQLFPSSSNIDYFQIEVRGGL